jgi:hypothetical protein
MIKLKSSCDDSWKREAQTSPPGRDCKLQSGRADRFQHKSQFTARQMETAAVVAVVVCLVLLGLLLGLLAACWCTPNWLRPVLVRIASRIDPRGDQPEFDELPSLPDPTTLRKRTIYIRDRGAHAPTIDPDIPANHGRTFPDRPRPLPRAPSLSTADTHRPHSQFTDDRSSSRESPAPRSCSVC